MSQKYPSISHFDHAKVEKLYTKKPILSSGNLGWNTLNFDCFSFDTHETPTFINQEHGISLILDAQGKHVDSENNHFEYRQNNGSCLIGYKKLGSFSIFPANSAFWGAWKGPIQFVNLSFK